MQTMPARKGECTPSDSRKLRRLRMATDYDAPRKTEDDSESIEALKERVPDKLSGSVDVEDADNPSGFELPGADLSDLELDVVVLPPQEDEFTCSNCFLVKHRSQLDHETQDGRLSARSALRSLRHTQRRGESVRRPRRDHPGGRRVIRIDHRDRRRSRRFRRG